ncbi:hypothetical protein CK507_07615 [Pseudomonas sp. WN033]|nr:hypothetical protein CK507_07615 [Pseudomonas sp. WN033]
MPPDGLKGIAAAHVRLNDHSVSIARLQNIMSMLAGWKLVESLREINLLLHIGHAGHSAR